MIFRWKLSLAIFRAAQHNWTQLCKIMGFVEFLWDDDIYETTGTVFFLIMYFYVLWNATLPLYVHLITLTFTTCADSAYSHAEHIQKWCFATSLEAHIDAENPFWHQGFMYEVLMHLQYKPDSVIFSRVEKQKWQDDRRTHDCPSGVWGESQASRVISRSHLSRLCT